MGDFEARITHPDGRALGWASGPSIRDADGDEWEIKDCKAADLVWLLDLPLAEVARVVEHSFSRYHIQINEKDSDDYVGAVIGAGLRDDEWADKALAWAMVHPLSKHAAVALRDYVDRTGNEQAAELLAAWRDRSIQVPRMDPVDLKKFVLDLLGGAIYTSAHMNQYEQMNLGMVFMPVLFGAFAVPEAALPFVAPLPDAPVEPTKLEPPPKPERGTVTEPTYLEIDGKTVEDLEFKARWDRAPEDAAAKYKAGVEAENDERRAKYNAEMAVLDKKHEEAMREWAGLCRAIDATHEEALVVWRATMEAWKEEHADLLAEHAKRDEIERKLSLEHASQVGILWEYLSQAGPRSINGMPMFTSVHIMHKDDWQRAAAAYERERERLDSLEV